MSSEWAPGGSDPELPELLLALVGPESPPTKGSRRKVLRLREFLESTQAGKLVPVSRLVPVPVPDVATMVRPPVPAFRAARVVEDPSADPLPFR